MLATYRTCKPDVRTRKLRFSVVWRRWSSARSAEVPSSAGHQEELTAVKVGGIVRPNWVLFHFLFPSLACSREQVPDGIVGFGFVRPKCGISDFEQKSQIALVNFTRTFRHAVGQDVGS